MSKDCREIRMFIETKPTSDGSKFSELAPLYGTLKNQEVGGYLISDILSWNLRVVFKAQVRGATKMNRQQPFFSGSGGFSERFL